jgi:beta-lactam-binding protein with PASTA domain
MRTLEAAGLHNAIASLSVRVTPHVPPGFIAAQVPWPGQPVRTYYGLDLIVSAGPRYRPQIRLDFCDYPQKTKCGDGYHEYETVSVMRRGEVLEGEPVVVPDVLGMGREQAARVLAAHHLLYRVVATGAGRDVVLTQRPSSGALAPAQSDVVIHVDCKTVRSEFPPDAFVFDACGGKYSQPGYA